MITEKFDPKKQHNYVEAKIAGSWYIVSHFFKHDDKENIWCVWIAGEGEVAIESVEAWEVVED